jgi:hypothetical protein
VDDTNLFSATVRIVNLLNAGQETLSATPGGGVSVAYDAGSGRLALTGSAPLAAYQAVLRTVTYVNSSQAPNTTARNIDFQVFDGPTGPNNAGNTARAVVSITAVENPTVVTTTAADGSAQEGVAAQVDAGILIVDPDTTSWAGGYLTATVQSGGNKDSLAIVTGGLVTVNGANVSYNGIQVGTIVGSGTDALRVNFVAAASPQAAQEIARRIFYTRATNGPTITERIISFAAKPTAALALSNVATRRLVIAAVNDAPVITISQPINVSEDVLTNIRSSITVTDVDSPSSIMRMTLAVQNGTLAYVGPFVSSGSGTNTLVITGTLAQLNDPTNVVINYLSFPDASATTDPLTVSVNDRDTAAPGPQTGSANGTITIAAVNDAPVLDLNGATAGTGFAVTFTEGGGPLAIVGNTATVFDIDSTNMLSATVQIANLLDGNSEVLTATVSAGVTRSYNPATGRLVLAGSATKAQWETILRTVTYRSTSQNPNTSAARTVNFQVFDNGTPPLGSAPVAATVTVVAVNDQPSLTLGVVPNVNEDTSLSIGGLIGITDLDAIAAESATLTVTVTNGTLTAAGATGLTVSGGGTSTLVVVGSLANLNTWKGGANALLYQGVLNFNGSVTLSVNYRDGSLVPTANLAAAQQQRTFTVNAVNDLPTLAANVGLALTQVVSPTVNVTPTITSALLAASDVDNGPADVLFKIITAPSPGALRLSGTPLPANGTFTQDDVANSRVTYTFSSAAVPISTSFTFQLCNGANCTGTDETFTISVTASP